MALRATGIVVFAELFLLCIGSNAGNNLTSAAPSAQAPRYVTTTACIQCHQTQYAAWSNSHHSWAWREPTRESIKADFGNSEFEHAGFTYRFDSDDDAFYVIADGPDGNAKRYRIHSVVGVTPLQQYLVETEAGRLQALDVAWDTERDRWYHLYPGEDTSAGNGLHWAGSYKNWNARCAECHATDFKKNYEPQTDHYRSTQAEIGVGCEACHGTGEAHFDWANTPDNFEQNAWVGVDDRGLAAAYKPDDAASQVNLCAACHSRREPLGADSPPPGSDFNDHYRLALLRDGLYFADGQILDEVYVLGSFLQSKMHAKGVRCTNCHDAHSYALKLPGNAVCTQCHNPAGNSAFASLKPADYDSKAHHFHEPDTEAAACKTCHMPERHYMVVDGRRDHSFRIPRPLLSAKLGSPDVCVDCHRGKTAEWAAGEIKARLPASRADESHFGEVFLSGSSPQDAGKRRQLMGLALDAKWPAIVRASALSRLSDSTMQPEWAQAVTLLSDDSPWVRSAAICVLRSAPGARRAEWLGPLLADPTRSVRIEAAKALLGVPREQIPEAAWPALNAAMEELQRSLASKADFPENQLVIGGVALTLRNLPAAVNAFQRAVEMDPQLIQAWMMLARIHAAVGDRDAVLKTLQQAVASNPADHSLKQALAELGSR